MKIVKADVADIPAIVSVFLRCWHISHRDILSQIVRDAMNRESATELWKKAFLPDSQKDIYLGLLEGQLVGFFGVGPDRDDNSCGHLFSLYINPDFARQGFGKILLAEGIRSLISRGFTSMSLWVFKENIAACSLYSDFGFLPTGKKRVTPEWEALEIEMSNENINE